MVGQVEGRRDRGLLAGRVVLGGAEVPLLEGEEEELLEGVLDEATGYHPGTPNIFLEFDTEVAVSYADEVCASYLWFAICRSTSVGPDRGSLGVSPESLAPVNPTTTATTTTTASTTGPASSVMAKQVSVGNGGAPGEGPWGQNRNHAAIVSASGVPGNVTTVAAIEAGGTWSTGTKGKGTTATTATTAPSQPTGGVIGAPGTGTPAAPPPPPSNPATSGSSWLKIVSQPRPAPPAPQPPQPQPQAAPVPPKPQAPPQVPPPSQVVVEDMSSLAPVSADGDVEVERGSGLSASDKTVGPPAKGAPSAPGQR